METGNYLRLPVRMNMTVDTRIRVGFLLAALALSALALVASGHGIHFVPLDEIGGVSN